MRMLCCRPMNTFVGMKNGGATCYMNAILQQLFMQPSVRKLLLSVHEVGTPADNVDNIFYQMQTMFANLALTNKEFHVPRAFWNAFKDYDGTRLNLREHQDAYEFFTRLQARNHVLLCFSMGLSQMTGACLGRLKICLIEQKCRLSGSEFTYSTLSKSPQLSA